MSKFNMVREDPFGKPTDSEMVCKINEYQGSETVAILSKSTLGVVISQ